ncbi:MAG TPA: cation diffusion facilitator family transporter [Caulobacteraceae bacterium]|nr:cation diffusion facilitator family transporter [Caulobacteraceae bacterium]
MAHDHPGHAHGDDHDGHDLDHHHHEGHGHSHAPKDFGAAFAIGALLNTAFIVVEAVFGVLAHSVALIADAGHNLSDVLGLLAAWGAAILVKRPPKGRFTYGLRGSSILAAVFNAVLLLIAIGAIALESIQRLANPQPVAGITVMVVAAVGIAVNGITAWLFAAGHKGDLNLRGVFLHMASDAVVSLGVVIAGLAIMLTGWTWLDPATSLVLVVVVAFGTWSLLRDSVCMSLHAAPAGIELAEVETFLRGRPGVSDLHDLHVWSMSTTETALTVHLLMPDGHPDDAALVGLALELKARFGIDHPTVQIETDPTVPCALEPAHTV